jgi:hypothetical protein
MYLVHAPRPAHDLFCPLRWGIELDADSPGVREDDGEKS